MTFEDLLEIGSNPRVHGNGFVQLDLPGKRRLHIFGHPDVPQQRTPTPIHDHRFSFESKVIIGRLVNVTYVLESLAAYHDYRVCVPKVRKDEDTILEPTDQTGMLQVRMTEVVMEGQSYKMQAEMLHETYVNQLTVTLMQKTGEAEGYTPKILCPMGRHPDNSFYRYDMDEAHLWAIIKEVVEWSPEAASK